MQIEIWDTEILPSHIYLFICMFLYLFIIFSKYLQSNINNFILGLKALTSLVEVSPHYAVGHQKAVINCLEDPDQTIQMKVTIICHLT